MRYDNQFNAEDGKSDKISQIQYRGTTKSNAPGNEKGFIHVWFGRLHNCTQT